MSRDIVAGVRTPSLSRSVPPWFLCALALAAPARAQDEDPAAWIRVKGATAELIDEPVLKGQVMLYRAGKRGGEPVLLVHGLGQNGARDWNELYPALAANYDVFALDLPGFGRSDKGNRLYSPDNFAAVIEKAVAPRIGKPFNLVGHSMGAAVSLEYAATYPQRVTRLILVDMAGVLHRAVYAGFLSRFQAQQMTGMYPGDASWFDSAVHRILMKVEQMPFSSELLLQIPALRERILKGDPNSIAGFALVDHDFGSELRAVKAPTLLIWGSEDKVASPRTAQVALATIPGARLEVIEGAGHVPQQQRVARFNALVIDELAGKPQGRPLALNTAPFDTARKERCEKRSGARYTGDIRELRLIGCTDVEITNARIGNLMAVDSEARLVQSEVRDGLEATASKIELTAGRVAGAPALLLLSSTLDAAGTRFEAAGPVATNRGADPVALSLSVCEVTHGSAVKYVHDIVTLSPGQQW